MGNQLGAPAKNQPESVAELTSVVYKDALGGGRFFKSSVCVHDDGGLVVVKVYLKRGDSPDVRPYEERLADIRNRLLAIHYPHVWPIQKFFHSERAVYLMRQYLFANLSRRITSRPFLSLIEKKWIAHQLILALAQCHRLEVCHGDIKAENVVMTSWDWVYLVDFAPYKPVMLPADNPADFSFFFDTSGRRKCCIAPERFYDSASSAQVQNVAAAQLTPAMDIFSVGCVLAELFMDGQPLFDYSKLLAYRQGSFDPAPSLDQLEGGVRQVVLHMIQKDPAQRRTAAEYVQMLSSLVLPPEMESVVHPFFSSMLHLGSDARVALVVEEHESLLQQLTHHRHMQAARQDSGVDPGLLGGAGHTLSGQPEQNSRGQAHPQTGASSLLSRAQGVLQQLEASPAKHTSSSSLAVSGRVLPKPSAKDESPRAHARSGWVRVHDGGEACAPPSGAPALTPDCGGAGGDTDAPGTVPVLGAEDAQEDRAAPPGDAGGERGGCVALLAVLLCTLLRGARLQEHKTRVVSLLRDTAQFCDDDVRLQRVVPYLVAATSDSMAAVKCRALRALAAVLAQVWAPWHPLAPPACCPPPPLCTCCSPRSCCSAALPCMPWCAMPPGSLIHAGPALHVNPRRARCKVQVQVVPPSDYKIFTEYILPCLSLLPTEGELSVQVEYASVVAQLAATAQAFLEQQQREQLLLLQKAAEGAPYEGGGLAPLNFDDEMTHLRDAVERAVHDLLVGPHDEPKLAILPHLDRLAAFCGRRDTADLLLPPLLTFVNSPHWQVRAAFFRHLAALGGSLGAEGLVAIIHPFLDRMLTGAEDAVVAEALGFLGQACTRGLLRKRFLLQVATKVHQLQLLQSASTAIRAGAVHLLAAAAAQLTPAEVYAQLLPLVLPQLTQEPLSLQVPSHIVRALPAHRPQGYTPSTGSQEVPPPPALTTPLSSSRRAAPHGTTSAALRNSLDSAMAQLSTTAPLHRSLGSGGASHLDSPAVPGAHSMIIPVPATAASYSIALDSRFRHPGSSFLAAALEQSLEESQSHGGHLIASSRDWAGGSNRLGRGRLHYSAHMSPAERGQHLVARAKRTVTHPGAPGGVRGEGALQHQLSPGAIYGAAIYGAEEGSPGRSGASGGAGVRDAMSAALAVGLPEGSGPSAAAAAAPPWRPQGVLLAHLAEHKKAVNRLAVSDNGAFFVSASNDESIKVWDCRRLEKDVSFRSRLTYTGQGGRITAVAACHDGQSVASGSSAGSIHIWRVEYTSRVGGAPDRYTGVTHTRKVSAESGAVLDIASWSPSLLVHTSQRGGVAAWDLRMQGEAWKLPNQPSKGMLERVVVDPCSQNWLLTGSTRGELCLWDIRFRLPVHSWQHPAAAPVAALALASAPAPRLGLRPGAAAGPMVYVAAGEHEVGLWDVAEGSCLQVLRVLRPGALEASRRAVPAALGPPAFTHLPFGARQLDMMGRAKQLGIGELQTPLPRKDGCRALLSTAAGPLLWAGMDRTIRCWDGVHPQESYVVCTAPPHIPQPQPAHVSAGARGGTAVSDGGGMLAKISALDVPRYQYSQRSVQGVPVLEECCTLERSSCIAGGGATPADHHPLRMGWAERALAQCHQQPILDLARVDSSPSPVLLSCSQDGVIKAWR